MLIGMVLYLLLNNKGWEEEEHFQPAAQEKEIVAVEDFLTNKKGSPADYSDAIQKAIDFCAAHGKEKVRFKANKEYVIKSGFTVKEGVKVEFGQNSLLSVAGNFQAIRMEKDAVIMNGTIQIVNPSFQSEVIFLKGADRFNSTNKTRIENMTIINKSASHKGTALSLYAKGPWHKISFVNFKDISIVGFKTGIQLKSENPGGGAYSWINANRFENITLEDCVLGIHLMGSMSIPNECSGNFFTGMQIQLTEYTKQVLKVDGSYNKFEGMVWDVHRIQSQEPLIVFSAKTERNQLEMNLNASYINDNGQRNEY